MPTPVAIGPATAAAVAALPLNTPTQFPDDPASVAGSLVMTATNFGKGQAQYAVLPVPGGPADVANQAIAAQAANAAAIQQKANGALGANQAFIALTPTFPLTVAEQQALVTQVVALTRQVDALIYLSLAQFSTTVGT